MKDFIEYIVKNLVDNPESVKIELFEGERSSVVEVHVAEADIAKVVGRQGRTIKALRTVAMTLGSRYDKRVRLELVD